MLFYLNRGRGVSHRGLAQWGVPQCGTSRGFESECIAKQWISKAPNEPLTSSASFGLNAGNVALVSQIHAMAGAAVRYSAVNKIQETLERNWEPGATLLYSHQPGDTQRLARTKEEAEPMSSICQTGPSLNPRRRCNHAHC